VVDFSQACIRPGQALARDAAFRYAATRCACLCLSLRGAPRSALTIVAYGYMAELVQLPANWLMRDLYRAGYPTQLAPVTPSRVESPATPSCWWLLPDFGLGAEVLALAEQRV
jgi:hypothetical protein